MAIDSRTGMTYDWGFNPGDGHILEDIQKMISMIDPYESPIFDALPKKRAKSVHHDWVEDSLPTDSSTAYGEGDDFSAGDLSVPSRKFNLTQIFRRDVKVSGTARAVDMVGSQDEYARQIEVAIKAVMRDTEKRLVNQPGESATGSTGTDVRKMKNLADFITTHDYQCGNTGIDGGGVSSAVTALTEDQFVGILREIWSDGGKPKDVFANPNLKQVISSFTGASISRATTPLEDKTRVAAVDVFDTDFGRQFIHLNVQMAISGTVTAKDEWASHRVFFLDTTKCEIARLRPLAHIPVDTGGDNVRGMVLQELALVVKNESGHGYIYGCGAKKNS